MELENKLSQRRSSQDPTLLQQQILQQIDDAISRLEELKDKAPDLADKIDAAIEKLTQMRDDVTSAGDPAIKEHLLTKLSEVRQTVRAAALQANQNVNDFIHGLNDNALAALRSVQELLQSGSGKLTGLSNTLNAYAAAMEQSQSPLAAGATLADTVSGYLADMEADIRRITDSAAFREFMEVLENRPDGIAD